MSDRPLWIWPVVDGALAGATELQRRVGAALPCFGWQYHDRDDAGAPLAGVCHRDGQRGDACSVRGLCAAAWPAARAAESALSLQHVPEEFRAEKRPHWRRGVSCADIPRRGYVTAARDTDRMLYAFMLAVGLPPTLYDRAWFSQSPAAHRWARANLGACFVCAPSSYHSVFAWRGDKYLLAARAWTNSTRRLRVDLMPELASAIMRDEWLRAAVQPIQRSMTAREALPGARFRVVLSGVRAAVELARIFMSTFGVSYEDVVERGMLWRGEYAAAPNMEVSAPESNLNIEAKFRPASAPVAVDGPVLVGRRADRR